MADIGPHTGADGHRPTEPEDVLGEAALRFFPGERVIHHLGDSTGYSGSTFARVEAAGGAWCLRLWPRGFEEGRLRHVHRSLLGIRTGGFAGVPRLAATGAGETMVEVAGRLADAQEWVAGWPLSAGSPARGVAMPNAVVRTSPGRLATLARAVAGLHRAGAGLAVRDEHGLPSLSERLTDLSVEFEELGEALTEASRSAGVPVEAGLGARWLGVIPEALDAARTAVMRLPGSGQTGNVLCHGDLWPIHAHFEGDVFAGFTDFESMIAAPPAFDLAQLVVHFGGWEGREGILRAYEAESPAGGTDIRAALPIEAVADLAGEGLWSLTALYGPARRGLGAAQRAAHLENLVGLIRPLESASLAARKVRP